MYLKRLQSVGFKSFAERIDVHFDRGVTAVVGPNGSGKSNIIDAVRWVLGEQSARSLRGQRMEDIIFQGSDTRKPLNFAEVTLTLDNSEQTLPLDYNEVSVTRRVYRSGDSEFYINKQACRLKDIIDLFMDSGLGKEAFSIISQGKVEEILSSKAEERRTIFEEAAGVLKYKQRKHKAEFKLSETEENLNRVEDIIYEIKQQIDPLKVQAKKAKQYNTLTDELKQIEIRLLITEIDDLHSKWKKCLNLIDREQLNEIKLKTSIQEREAKLTEDRHHLQQLDEEISKLQSDLLEATELLEKYEGEKNVLEERLKHYQENKTKLEQDKQMIEENRNTLLETIQKEQARLEMLHSEKNDITHKISELKKSLHHESDEIHAKIEDLKSDYIELLNERAVAQNERQSVQHERQRLEIKQHEQEDSHSHVVSKRKDILSKRAATANKINTLTNDITVEKDKKEQLKNKLNRLNEELDKVSVNRYAEIDQLTKLTARKETLEEMKESFQGYFYGVRELLKQSKKQNCFTIYGTVFDLIRVPHEYVTAIDTILGAQAQHIVVKEDSDARDAIDWLKHKNKGRATFLPINSIQDRSLPAHVLNTIKTEDGFIGIASDVIETTANFQIVANHLVGNVILTKTLRDANAIAQLTGRRYRIVTLDGDVVFPGGSMSGGAKKRTNQSLFTREKDLQVISKTIGKRKQTIQALTETMNKLKANIKQIEHQTETIRPTIEQLNDKLETLQTAYNRLEISMATLNDELRSYDLSVKVQKEEKERLGNREATLNNLLTELEQNLTDVQSEINTLTEYEKELKTTEADRQEELHQLEISLAEQEERIKNQSEKMTNLHLRLKEIEEDYTQVKERLTDLIQIKQSEHQKEVTKKRINEQITLRDLAKETLLEKQQARGILNQQIEDEQRDVKEENKRHEALINVIQEQEVQANRLDVALETRLTQLEKEYVMTFEKASNKYEKVEDVSSASEIVNSLKHQIKQLGSINLGAIDEYDRIVERYEFLTEQQNDLLEAKRTLYSVIEEMDEEMINRFSTTFSHIQKAFTTVFKELFGGGHAELILTDEANILETGIEIVARPPGKKLRTIGLLSGGEKALTAISLLFAILRVRPVPFCILDEVEAALDEANVVRFAKYVKMYSEETQFIVITHRKGTMEEADVLYGVTMQESGVSRLVSVRLEDTEDLVTAN